MIDVLINGQSGLVRDIENIGFKSVFAREFNELELTTDTISLVLGSTTLIYQHIQTYGCEVGMPCTIVDETASYDYIIDLTQKPIFSERGIDVKIRKRKGKGLFMDNALGSTFESLRAQGVVYPSFTTPYVIIKDNQFEQGLTLSISIFSMVQATAQAVKDTISLSYELAGAIGSLSPALIIAAGLKLAAQLVYDFVIFKALLDLTKRFKELIFPKIRYLNACTVFELINQSCINLGYTFKSNLLSTLGGLSILPVPLQKTNKSIFNFKQDDLNSAFNKGYPTASDSVPTLGLLIQAIELTFNASMRVVDGVVQIERRDYWATIPSVNITPALNDQEKRQDVYSLNTDEAWSRYFIQYQTDFSDLNTLNELTGTYREIGAKNTNLPSADLNLLKGLKQVDIPFSLVSRKEEYSFIEKLALELFIIIDALTGLNTASIIQNRIGVAQFSQQFFENTKLLYIVNSKQPSNYLDYIGATALYNNYHSIEEITNVSFREYDGAPVIINFAQYQQLLNNNYITIDGISCEVVDMEYIPYHSKAIINYRKPDTWAIGKIVTFVVN